MSELTYQTTADQIDTIRSADHAVYVVRQKDDDTLRYKVSVSKAVAQDTVRVISQVNVLVQPEEKSEKIMTLRVLPALNAFIQGDWVISALDRRSDASGYERLTMQASIRVAFVENFNLADRARKASREGISISDSEVNRTASPEKVKLVVKELWYKIIETINQQIPHFNELTGRHWRIGDVDYGVAERGNDQRNTKGSSRSEVDQYFSGTDDPSIKQGGERITFDASVTLRAHA